MSIVAVGTAERGGHEVEGHHPKLEGRPAAEEKDRVPFRHLEELPDEGLRPVVDFVVVFAAVTRLHERHSRPVVIDELLLNLLENRERQRCRTGVKIEDPCHGKSVAEAGFLIYRIPV
jgi:hypothetical protein